MVHADTLHDTHVRVWGPTGELTSYDALELVTAEEKARMSHTSCGLAWLQGKSVLVRESLEKAEHYVHQLQKHSLHATMEREQ